MLQDAIHFAYIRQVNGQYLYAILTVFYNTYLHAAQVTMPFCSTHYSSWNILIYKSIKRCRINKTIRQDPIPAQAVTTITRGRENIYLIYLGNWADPCALMDDYLHKEMLNASESLCFPLQKKNSEVSGEIQKIFLKVQLHGYKPPSSLSCTPLRNYN